MNLKPINLLPARERVASALRKAIISRDFQSGEQITLEAISGLLGVSKTPVREALLMLENEGLVKIMPNKHMIVLGVTEKNIREHFQIRAALESEAVAGCCKDTVDIQEIREIFEESKKIVLDKAYEEYSNMNQAFHLAIWKTAGNERMEKMLSTMWNGLSIHHMETIDSYAEKSFSEHQMIYEAIEAKNEDMARKLMYRHIERSMNDMITNLEYTDTD